MKIVPAILFYYILEPPPCGRGRQTPLPSTTGATIPKGIQEAISPRPLILRSPDFWLPEIIATLPGKFECSISKTEKSGPENVHHHL